jgi:hypothetical protein
LLGHGWSRLRLCDCRDSGLRLLLGRSRLRLWHWRGSALLLLLNRWSHPRLSRHPSQIGVFPSKPQQKLRVEAKKLRIINCFDRLVKRQDEQLDLFMRILSSKLSLQRSNLPLR